MNHEKISNVLVTGAGTSADFGIPLGREVLDQAIGMASDIAQRFSKNQFPFSATGPRLSANDFPQAALSRVLSPHGQIDPLELADALENSSSSTVDNFALERPNFSDAARFLSASVLVPKSFTLNQQRAEPTKLNRYYQRGESRSRNWIDLFISVVKERRRREGKRSWTIVSFNYDGLLEAHLRSRWIADSVHGQFDSVFEFIYPYGVFRPDGRYENVRTLGHKLINGIPNLGEP